MTSLVAFIVNLLRGTRNEPTRSECKTRIWGKTTRDLLKVFNKYEDDQFHLPISHIREAFNSIGLYPSNSQVFEMVQCAVQYGSPCEPDHITFGEFTILVTELQNCYKRKLGPPEPRSLIKDKLATGTECQRWKRRVFLGGSCNPTAWRQEMAIPYLKKHGMTFYNPQVQEWRPELMELEEQAKQTADLLFFVVDNRTRAVSSMIETAYLCACQRQLILVVDELTDDNIQFGGEQASKKEIDDILRARLILTDLMERNSIPVFWDINTALKCAVTVLQKNIPVSELGLKDGALPTKYGHLKVAELMLQMRESFNSMDNSGEGSLCLSDLCLAYKSCMGEELDVKWFKQFGQRGSGPFTFEDFCCIITEYTNREKPLLQRLLSLAGNLLPNLPQNSVYYTSPVSNGPTIDIYLGGSCGDKSWRDRIAIPMLRKYGLSYANPFIGLNDWEQRLVPIQVAAREKCRLLLYVITDRTRSISSMIEAGYYIGMKCKVILCVQYIMDDALIGGEKMSCAALKDYHRGRSYLTDLASREGVQLFDDIEEAVECAIGHLTESTIVKQSASRGNSPQKCRSPTL